MLSKIKGFRTMRQLLVLCIILIITGCATRLPYKELDLDTTSNFTKPSDGKSGIYVYQWKTLTLGALLDVDFEIVGFPELSLNTGEYGYFEIAPGSYEYKFTGGLFAQYQDVTIEADQNYFFRATVLQLSDSALLIREQHEIDDAKEFITNGKYEKHDVD
jgi:hypothetical protein